MLCVYDKLTRQNEFGNCGLGILKPSKMITREELNGDYSIEIEYPISNSDPMWAYLSPYNIVRNSEGQLFFIHTCETSMNSSGAVMRAQGSHISYYLKDKNVKEFEYKGATGWIAMEEVKKHIEYNWDNAEWEQFGYHGHDDRLVDYDFYMASNFTSERHDISFVKINAYAALIGAENSVLNLFGGELYRDNFYISINDRKEHYKDDAFCVEHGVNMLEIKERVSIKDLVTGVWATDNLGNSKTYTKSELGVAPHQINKAMQFSYSENSNLENDAKEYWRSNLDADVSYEIRFKDLRKHEKYKDWMALQSFKVGDTGTVRSEFLGIDVQQKIIARTLNDITGETESITLGNFMPSMFRTSKYSNLVARSDSSGRRLNAIERLQLNKMFRWEDE